jgi:PAS domain S-box-containing protein
MGGDALLTPRLRAVLDELPALVLVMRGEDLVVEIANPRRPGLPQGAAVEGLPADQMLRAALAEPADRERYLRVLREVMRSGRAVRELESVVRFAGDDEDTYWDVVVLPLRDGGEGAASDGVVLFATEVTRLVAARLRAEQAEHRFNTLFAADVLGVSISDEERILEANDAFLAMIGRTREDLDAGLRWPDLTPQEFREADERALRALRGTGAVAPYEKAYVRPDGSRVAALIGGTRISEHPFRVLATSYDLSARKAAEAEVAALLARTRRLQEITATLSASNSAATIARTVVHHGIEELGASAAILLRLDGEMTVEHAVGLDRAQVEQWRTFPATMPAVLRSPTGMPEPAGDLLPGGTAMAVPIAGADGSPLGTIAVAFRRAGVLDQADADFLFALAWQAGLALDRTRLYENRAYVARKLQEGLLPDRLATVPGLESAAVYESIAGGGEVGGDFYDLFENGADRWFACVGDVCGKGTDAAVVTGLARHTVRAIAQTSHRPAEVLSFLNGALLRHSAVASFCTMGCAALSPDPAGGFAVELSSGGHPFPFVLRADGELEEIQVVGTMLGVSDAPELANVPLRLAPGDALILYTDGVADARHVGGERFSESRLRAAVQGAAGAGADGIATAVEAAVRAHLPGPSADDRAIVVLRAAP